MQMATNLGYDNAQKFLLGRRAHHSSMRDGTHDEDAENGVYEDVLDLSRGHYVNDRCSECHERNGSAEVAEDGELLDRWVFKIGDDNGQATVNQGSVLQPISVSGTNNEGGVSIEFWSETEDGLRTPNYVFENGTPPQFSARLSPRLVGLGLLEAIKEEDILALEDIDDINNDGISGRAHRVSDPSDPSLTRIGRFGWKASTVSVEHQVAGALNTDMGVMSELLPKADCGSEQSSCESGNPMSEEVFDNLVTYISTLGVRAQRILKSGFEDTQVLEGKALFQEINCTGCHTETFQTSTFHPLTEVRDQTIHPYTDMLLHDMGDGLADTLAEGDASGREWRTTPLWGLGLSACVTGGVTNPTGNEGDEICTPHHAYLHDGRARSIEEAILWHGGEGQASNDAYQALSNEEKEDVLKFLESL